MAYQQVAKLYLRGSLCNVTLKNLSPEQRQELEDLIEMVVADPGLTQCRIEFCNALKRTIRNEYEDHEIAMQDYRIAVMRAAVAALHGWMGKKPTSDVVTDPFKRKKWFQTWVFNYLRQVLRENKLPYIKRVHKERLPPIEAAIASIKIMLSDILKKESNTHHKRYLKSVVENLQLIENQNISNLYFDHWSFPAQLADKILQLNEVYLTSGIEILYVIDGIQFRQIADCADVGIISEVQSLVRMTSFDNNWKEEKDDGPGDQLMLAAVVQKGIIQDFEEEEVISKLRNRLPDDAHPVLDIFMEETRPDQYIKTFGEGQPRISHIAQFLNISPKEAKRLHGIIKINMTVLKLGY